MVTASCVIASSVPPGRGAELEPRQHLRIDRTLQYLTNLVARSLTLADLCDSTTRIKPPLLPARETGNLSE